MRNYREYKESVIKKLKRQRDDEGDANVCMLKKRSGKEERQAVAIKSLSVLL